jgi:hypothetical protein
MSAMPPQPTVVTVKPQSNIYTLLLIVSILVLAATTGIVLYNLMTSYGLSLGDLFKPQQVPPT